MRLNEAEKESAADLAFLTGGGKLGALIRAHDWSATSLGPIARWPQSLKTTVSLMLLSAVPIVLLWGEDGVMIYNAPYSTFAGSRHPRLLGQKVREGWPEVAAFNDKVLRIGLAGGSLAFRDEQLTLERHGRPEPVWMNLDYSPVLGEDGKPAGVIALVLETTERVPAARRLRESEAKFRALVNATSDMVYRMSPDWSEMRALHGRGMLADADRPTGSWLDDYVSPEDRARVDAAAREAARTGGVFQLEHRVRRMDGSDGWVFSRAVPIRDEQGEIVEWFGAASDVTERHRVEEHLRLVVNELNHRVK
ncbi:PAS domain-containing protein, partial [Sphingomonas sp.]|uniref:PAS domain-containing protein n=1 Tax=Sphingomonas sp. TaxID=28214 RepID=UPI003B3A2033